MITLSELGYSSLFTINSFLRLIAAFENIYASQVVSESRADRIWHFALTIGVELGVVQGGIYAIRCHKLIVASHLSDGSTAVVDGANGVALGHTCRVAGVWDLVSVDADGVLLHRVDEARVDYTVERVPRCR